MDGTIPKAEGRDTSLRSCPFQPVHISVIPSDVEALITPKQDIVESNPVI